ncbi:MAG: hypothetical protein F6K00_02340 [Leptolyngbya sp. SIOISBB]|nr:hypothetical protein [Leptolyngbya sp. SIOISBB]
MDEITLKKIEKFSRITPSMHLAFERVVDDWSPEIPPLTILFAEIGDSFVRDFKAIDDRESQAVFNAIETMLTGKDEALNVGASTGFLEAIAVKPEFDKKAKSMLGEESKKFLHAWLQFMNSPNLDS